MFFSSLKKRSVKLRRRDTEYKELCENISPFTSKDEVVLEVTNRTNVTFKLNRRSKSVPQEIRKEPEGTVGDVERIR